MVEALLLWCPVMQYEQVASCDPKEALDGLHLPQLVTVVDVGDLTGGGNWLRPDKTSPNTNTNEYKSKQKKVSKLDISFYRPT